MKVKELIQELSKFNPNKEVRVLGFEEYEGCFTTPYIAIIEENENNENYLFLGCAEED